jgi:predicted nucleotidyltransferase
MPASKDTSEVLAKATAILREAGATEVYVFGSVSRGTAGDHSDLDLAVAGLPDDRVIPTLSRLLAELGLVADLIQVEREPTFVRYLESKGELRRVA